MGGPSFERGDEHVTLTQKESMLLQDLKTSDEICIQKEEQGHRQMLYDYMAAHRMCA